MWDLGWRSLAVGLVFLADLIVFADLARAELRDLREARAQADRQAPPLPLANEGLRQVAS